MYLHVNKVCIFAAWRIIHQFYIKYWLTPELTSVDCGNDEVANDQLVFWGHKDKQKDLDPQIMVQPQLPEINFLISCKLVKGAGMTLHWDLQEDR